MRHILISIFMCFALLGCEQASDSPEVNATAKAKQGAGDGSGKGAGEGRQAQRDAASDELPQGKFADGTDRVWGGFARGKCGAKIYLIDPTGARIDFEFPADLAEPLVSTTIKTVENNMRDGFRPADVFRTYGGSYMKVFSCDEGRVANVSLEESDRFMFILNGRKTIKLMEAHDPEPATTPVRMLEHIELYAEEPVVDPAGTGSE